MEQATIQFVSAWSGLSYELDVELGPIGDDSRAMRAIRALWSHPQITGPWDSPEAFDLAPDPPPRPDSRSHLIRYGFLAGSSDSQLGFVSWLIRAGESDSLTLSIPVAILEGSFPCVFPLSAETNPWLQSLNDILADVASHIFAAASFQAAWIGEEAGAVAPPAHALTAADCEHGGVILPEATWQKLSPTWPAVRLCTGLMYTK